MTGGERTIDNERQERMTPQAMLGVLVFIFFSTNFNYRNSW